ncbi:hypothetical protein J2X66_001425 [Pseudomonas sp. 3296]|nr:DUF2931 family protein [Pseudomonas sp. 3296]MDR6914561.1 hypothetical protein [Pseudomonas sp. 3296]
MVNGPALPYDAWALDFFAPPKVWAWIEKAEVVDLNGNVFSGAEIGRVSTMSSSPLHLGPSFLFKPNGYPEHAMGSERRFDDASLPRLIYVRWKSLAEVQTYEAVIEISELARAIMLKSEEAYCRRVGKRKMDYRNILTIGLEPDGIATVYLEGSCLQATQIMQVQATIQPKVPYRGASNRSE